MGLIGSRKTDHWDWAECRENQVLLTVTKPATDDWCGRRRRLPDHWTFMCGNRLRCGVKRLTRKWDMVNDALDLVLNFALTEVLVPQWGTLNEWLAGETWRFNKCSHMWTVLKSANSGFCTLSCTQSTEPGQWTRHDWKAWELLSNDRSSVSLVTLSEWRQCCAVTE